MSDEQIYELFLLSLCCWREARGENLEAKRGQLWSVRNRVNRPSWWGKDWISVILKPYQYSSFNKDDPNATKWPSPLDSSWIACQKIAREVYDGQGPDPTAGATHYHDTSIEPPNWAGEMQKTVQLGAFIFYRA